MAEEIRETIAELNRALEASGAKYKLTFTDPAEIRLLDKNARYMSEDMFRNLVENIKRDGGLSSLPLCYRQEDGGLLVLSGNHRVQAAVHAGLEGILVLVIDKQLTREEQVAIQLSHNAIEGKDDPVILKELWEEIQDIELKLYAGLDSEILQELDKIEFVSIAEARIDHKQVTFLFLPEEAEALKKLMGEAELLFIGDESFVLSRKHYDDVFALVADVKEHFEIVNNPTAMMKIVELARERIGEMSKTMPPKEEQKQ